MKSLFKSTFSFILVAIFLFACFAGLFIIFFAAWLHTYNAFTREKPIAEITISEQKIDEKGPYAEVTVTPIQADNNALSSIFTGKENPNPLQMDTQTYRLYGDTITFGGPLIEFKDWLKLLNLESIYRFNIIYAQYLVDVELEKNRTPEIASIYEIGGGDSRWREIADQMRANNLQGQFFRNFFDSEPEGKATSVYVNTMPVTGKLYITDTGFDWREDR